MGRPGGHQHVPACERALRARREQRLDGGDDLERLRHPADAGLAVLGHLAAVGADDGDAVGDEPVEIAPGRRMLPHPRIHRRRDQHRLVGREQHRRGEVVGVPARHLRHQVGGRRRDHHEIGVAGEPDVADVELGLRVEEIGVGMLPGDGAGGQRRDEGLGGRGHHHAHRAAALAQAADEVERLIRGDASPDDEEDAPAADRTGLGAHQSR